MAHFETQLSEEEIFQGRVIRVTRDTVQLENGHTSTREVVHHNGGAAVAALNEKGEIYLVRQYRYALGKELIEIPAGKLEKGEDPRRALRRELLEELDMTAEVYDIFDTVTHEYPDFTITLYVCLCRRLSDYKLKEHVRVVPLSSSELDPADWAPADAHTVSKIRSHLL